SFSVHSKVADGEGFRLMQRYAGWKAAELGKRMMDGETAAEPYVYGKENACTWCSYYGVCCFDGRLPGCTARLLYKQDETAVFREMQERLSDRENKEEQI
ncbi:MAG: hypothetical protein HUJ73_05075, partial [Eubacterium sp.]|nr:hypothetical protein [Eubacterium sp.]